MCACALHPLEGRQRFGLTPSGDLARLSDVWREVWVEGCALARTLPLGLWFVSGCVSPRKVPSDCRELHLELVRTGGRAPFGALGWSEDHDCLPYGLGPAF